MYKKTLTVDCAKFGHRSFVGISVDSFEFKIDVKILVELKSHAVRDGFDLAETEETNARAVSDGAFADT